jgi:hypothetical protein
MTDVAMPSKTLGTKDMITETSKSTIADAPVVKGTLPPNVGPEAMIAWLMSQMRTSNKDVRGALTEVETARKRLDVLRGVQQSLRDHKTACHKVGDVSQVNMSDDHGITWSDYETSGGKIDMDKLAKAEWYQALSPEGKKAAEQFIGEGLDGSVNEGEVDKFMDSLKDDVASINSENELLMIGLQHTMQTRNQAIQLASNIISVLDRAADSVIANMGK